MESNIVFPGKLLTTKPSGLSRSMKRKLWAYLFILPQLILFLVFTIYPIIMSYVYSMYEWSGIGPLETFTGLGNFKEVINEPNFWNAFSNSFLFMSGTIVLQLPFALVLAIILNSKLRGKTFYRTVFFLPVVTTTAVVGAVMQNIFATDNGLVNHVLMKVGMISSNVPWLGNGSYALGVLIFVSSWKWFGVKMIYWLAGLQSIPQDVYEAATIDGAGNWKTFRYITLPLLVPVGSVILLLSVVDGLHAFDLVKVMTNGGPGVATEMVDLYIYRFAFSGVGSGLPEIGYASAAGIFFGITVFIISILLGLLVKWSNRRVG